MCNIKLSTTKLKGCFWSDLYKLDAQVKTDVWLITQGFSQSTNPSIRSLFHKPRMFVPFSLITAVEDGVSAFNVSFNRQLIKLWLIDSLRCIWISRFMAVKPSLCIDQLVKLDYWTPWLDSMILSFHLIIEVIIIFAFRQHSVDLIIQTVLVHAWSLALNLMLIGLNVSSLH